MTLTPLVSAPTGRPGITAAGLVLGLAAAEDYLIVSTGKGGVRETWVYDPARPDAGLFAVEVPGDYEKDIVIWNGRLVRGPKGAR